jgi:uncharacterized protein YkwD
MAIAIAPTGAPSNPATLSSLPADRIAQATPDFHQQVLDELNRVRTNPAAYADWLDQQRSHYNGTILSLPGESPVQTHEGVQALDEAIATLRSLDPLPALLPSSGMTHAAETHVADIGSTGQMSSQGQDGSNFGDRLNRFGDWQGNATELLSFGKQTPSGVIFQWLVNDGDPNRTIRSMLLSENYGVAGIDCGSHAVRQTVCVLDMATGYVEADGTELGQQQSQPESGEDLEAAIADLLALPTAMVAATHNSHEDSSIRELEQQILDETNLLRTNPAYYADLLRSLRDRYDGNLFMLTDSFAIETEEGQHALDEAIDVLEDTNPLPPLTLSDGMSDGAADHASDLGTEGLIGHIGSDNSTPLERVSRYGTPARMVGENVSYVPDVLNLARWHVIQLVVDDGVPDRGHRETLLNRHYHIMGVACADHKVYENVCVMDYTVGYTE